MIKRRNITGIILAGGKSSRMGTDKGFLKLDGISFTEHIIASLKPLVNTIIIVSDNSEYDTFGCRRVEDLIKDSGPLAGLYTGLFHSETEYNLVLSCDVPLVNTILLSNLIEEIDEETDAVQLQSQSKTIPLVALYRKHCMATCLDLLKKDEKRLRVAIDLLNTKNITVAPEMEPYVKNINTKDQLNELQNAVEH